MQYSANITLRWVENMKRREDTKEIIFNTTDIKLANRMLTSCITKAVISGKIISGEVNSINGRA